MKKYILITLLASVLAVSCSESFLEENPRNSQNATGVYTSTPGFDAALNGLLAYTRLEYQTWAEATTLPDPAVIATAQAGPYEVLQLGLDMGQTTWGDKSMTPHENYSFNASDVYVKHKWKWAYGLITNANMIINYAESTSVAWNNPANDKLYFQANARFIRAYAYLVLTYLYGDVPWITDVSDPYKTDFQRTPKAEVLKNITDDLEFAAKYLPANPSNVKDGQLTRWAALHLLSEVCLLSGDYVRAVSAADSVIKSSHFALNKTRFGFHTDEAGDVFSDMFKEKNHNYKGGNKEAIWVIQAEYNTQGGGRNRNDWSRRAWVCTYFNIAGFEISPVYGGRGVGQIRPMDWVVDNLYEANDVRNSEYNIRRNYYYNKKNAPNYGQLHVITNDDKNVTGNCFPSITKFDFGIADNAMYEGNNKDRYKFRLAETYLLLAEAYLRQNKIPEATIAINEVRKRAGATPAQESEVNMDYLLDERIRELIGEEVRRFTLARTGKLIERTKKYNEKAKNFIQAKHVLWPIPQEVTDANSGAEWASNW